MKGITYITDTNNIKQGLIIDLKTIEKHEDEIHELIDVLVAESRSKGEIVDWQEAKKTLKQKGHL